MALLSLALAPTARAGGYAFAPRSPGGHGAEGYLPPSTPSDRRGSELFRAIPRLGRYYDSFSEEGRALVTPWVAGTDRDSASPPYDGAAPSRVVATAAHPYSGFRSTIPTEGTLTLTQKLRASIPTPLASPSLLDAILGPVGPIGLAVGSSVATSTNLTVLGTPRLRDWFPFASLVSRLRREKLLDHPTRRRVLARIQEYPGVRYGRLRRDLGLPRGSLTFHLAQLERGGEIHIVRIRGRTHLYSAGNARGPEAFLLTERQLKIISFLRTAPGASQHALSRALGYSRSSTSYNLRVLRELGFVEMARVGRQTLCFLPEGLEIVPGRSTTVMTP